MPLPVGEIGTHAVKDLVEHTHAVRSSPQNRYWCATDRSPASLVPGLACHEPTGGTEYPIRSLQIVRESETLLACGTALPAETRCGAGFPAGSAPKPWSVAPECAQSGR